MIFLSILVSVYVLWRGVVYVVYVCFVWYLVCVFLCVACRVYVYVWYVGYMCVLWVCVCGRWCVCVW